MVTLAEMLLAELGPEGRNSKKSAPGGRSAAKDGPVSGIQGIVRGALVPPPPAGKSGVYRKGEFPHPDPEVDFDDVPGGVDSGVPGSSRVEKLAADFGKRYILVGSSDYLNARNAGDVLDLHQLHVDEALRLVKEKVLAATLMGKTMLVIIPGKGNHSLRQQPVLYPAVVKVLNELKRSGFVRDFQPVVDKDRGTGSLLVYLKNVE